MRIKVFLSMVIALALLAVFGLGYRSGDATASKHTVIFARDSADAPPLGSLKQGYKPYFTRGNPISGAGQ